MGLENRDYVRERSYTDTLTGLGLDFTPIVKYLIIANVIVFLLQIFVLRTDPVEGPEGFESWASQARAAREKHRANLDKAAAEADDGENRDEIDWEKQQEAMRKFRQMMERMMVGQTGTKVSVVQEWFQLDPQKTVYQGQLWRLLTSAFCHDRFAIWHILFNMLALYWFGTRLEAMYGSREFLLFYLVAALCGSVAYVGLAFYTGSSTPAIGASGAVMGVMMLYTIFYPFETFLLFWVIPVPLWVLLSVYVLYDVHPVLLTLSGEHVFTHVAHAGHLGGLAFGFMYWKLGLHLEAALPAVGRPRRRFVPPRRPAAEPPPVIEEPAPDMLNEDVDEVLRKISAQGADSLTEQERALLLQASAKYRGQR